MHGRLEFLPSVNVSGRAVTHRLSETDIFSGGADTKNVDLSGNIGSDCVVDWLPLCGQEKVVHRC